MVGTYSKARILAKNQQTQKKSLYFVNTKNASLSKVNFLSTIIFFIEEYEFRRPFLSIFESRYFFNSWPIFDQL